MENLSANTQLAPTSAPAALQALAISLIVEPVVRTSSNSSTGPVGLVPNLMLSETFLTRSNLPNRR